MQQETAAATETKTTNEEQKNTQQTKTEIKIPAFLDCTFNAVAKSVIYDNLTLKNVSGKLIVKDEKVDLQNLQTDIFDGKTAISGNVSTKGNASTFAVNLDMNRLNVIQSFTQIEMLKKILPIAKVVEGFFSSKINVSGKLTPELTPDLNTISGSLFASLIDSRIKDTSPLISALDSQFNKLNLSKLNLNDIKANITFENGKVVIKPFDIKWNNSTIKVAGTHGFDQTMNYNLIFNVPPSMLGGDAQNILSKLTDTEQQKLGNIPVNIVVGGDFSKPKLSTDMKQVANNLTQQIVKAQANKLTNKVVDEVSNKASDLLGKALGGKTEAVQDSSKTQTKQHVQKAVNNVLNGLFNRKKDTTSSK